MLWSTGAFSNRLQKVEGDIPPRLGHTSCTAVSWPLSELLLCIDNNTLNLAAVAVTPGEASGSVALQSRIVVGWGLMGGRSGSL
jgi:hypothetical protein